MAKIIGEAAVRLRADSKGLAAEMRVILSTALREATAGIGPGSTKGVEDDANKTATKVKGILGGILQSAQGVGSRLASAASAGIRLTLIGAAAGVALAGVSSLVTGLVGLIGTLGQAAGVAGLLPAAFVALKAVTATVQIGFQGVGDSLSALASGDMKKFQDSLKGLSPEARDVIGSLGQFKDQIKLLKESTQDDIFLGLKKPLNDLVGSTLPQARALFNGIALSINGAAKESLTFLNSAQAQSSIATLFGNIRTSVSSLAPAFQPLIAAFLDISTVGSSFLPQVTAGIAGLAQRFSSFISGAAQSGALANFFQKAIDTVKQLGQVLVQFGGGFAAVFHAASAAGGGFLNGLLQIATAFNQFASSASGQSALISFFSSMRAIIAQVIPVILQVVQVVANTVVPIFMDLANAVLPVIGDVVKTFGDALAQARPGIVALAQGFAALFQAIGPVLGVVVQIAGILGGVLGKVLQTLAPVIAKVAGVIADGLLAVLPQLEPVIIQVADAVVQLINAALPIIPIFFQLVAALLPLLPPLLQLVATLLPPLIALVQSLMPIIQAFAQILLALLPPLISVAQTILGILIPPIQLIAAVVSQVAQLVASVIQGMAATVTTILQTLGAIITGIWTTIVGVFTTAVNSIGSFVRGGFEAIKNTIGNVLGGIASAVSSGLQTVIGFFRDLPGKILGFLADLPAKAFEVGKNIIQGIINGLGNLAGAIIDKIKGIIKGAWDAVVDFFSIFSPSRLAIRTFEQVGRGMIVGLDNMSNPVRDAALGLAKTAMDGLNSPLGGGINLGPVDGGATAGTTGATGAGVVINQTNVMQPGTDVRQFASEVNKTSAQRLAAGNSALPVSTGQVQNGIAAPGSLFGVSGA